MRGADRFGREPVRAPTRFGLARPAAKAPENGGSRRPERPAGSGDPARRHWFAMSERSAATSMPLNFPALSNSSESTTHASSP